MFEIGVMVMDFLITTGYCEIAMTVVVVGEIIAITLVQLLLIPVLPGDTSPSQRRRKAYSAT